MITEYCKITGNSETDSLIIRKAAEIIRGGGLVAIPTETVYGLAGSALIPESAEKIFAAKGRPSDNPLIVHISEPREAEAFAHTCPAFYTLAEQFMPGPLTIILPKKDCIPKSVTGGLNTVAIRCPEHPIARAIIKESGHPIAAPSANRSGIPSPTTGEHVRADMDGRIDMIVDGGSCSIGVESTVITLTEDGCIILRPGAVTEEMLSAYLPHVTVAASVIDPNLVKGEAVLSPGMKYKHYAPTAEVILLDGADEAFRGYVTSHASERFGILASAEYRGFAESIGEGAVFLSLGGSTKEANQRLFGLLREADEKGLSVIYAKCPPRDGEGLAFFNRIIRAAGGKLTKI